MNDSPVLGAGQSSTSATQWTSVGGVLVNREVLVKAIGALSALPDSDTVIIKSLKDIASPLADTAYRQLADRYMRDHPEDSELKTADLKHPPRRRVAFIRMLERHLRTLDWLASATDTAGLSPVPDVLGKADARKRITRDVVARQGQAQFRDMLIRAYDGRCAITGYNAPHTLEAAHIRPYQGEHTNVVANGLLLRADIHTLFDLSLLAIRPSTLTVAISDELAGTPYETLKDKPLRLPATPEMHPDPTLLAERWMWFEDKQAAPQIS